MRIPMEDWLRGCVYHDGRHGEVTLSTDKVLEIANYIQLTRTSLADGMIELPPYDCKDESQTDCKTCKYGQDKHRYAHICNECGVGINNYTPQTERSE